MVKDACQRLVKIKLSLFLDSDGSAALQKVERMVTRSVKVSEITDNFPPDAP